MDLDGDVKQCPFCGGTSEWRYTPWDYETRTGDDGTGWVVCGDEVQDLAGCGATFFGVTRGEGVAAWNKRESDIKQVTATRCAEIAMENYTGSDALYEIQEEFNLLELKKGSE